MRLVYSLLFLLTIVFSDVISNAVYTSEHDMVLVDLNSESESESETELEIEVKKEAKIHAQGGFNIEFHADALKSGLPNDKGVNLVSPHLEIHSPPPKEL